MILGLCCWCRVGRFGSNIWVEMDSCGDEANMYKEARFLHCIRCYHYLINQSQHLIDLEYIAFRSSIYRIESIITFSTLSINSVHQVSCTATPLNTTHQPFSPLPPPSTSRLRKHAFHLPSPLRPRHLRNHRSLRAGATPRSCHSNWCLSRRSGRRR